MSYSVARAGGLRMTAGRITALVIGVPIALALIAFTGFNFVADLGQASFPVNDSFAVHNGQVTAQIAGDITLRQGPVNAARLTGTAHYSLFRPTVTESGSTVSFDCSFHFGNCSLDGTLEVPQDTAVSLSTSGGDVSASALDATTLQLTSDGGNVSADSVVAPTANVRSIGGDVSMTFIQAPGSLTITSDGGNVTLALPHGAYRFVTSADGGNDSHPQDSANPTSTINVHSVGGDISITEAS
jgi:hypothetical protein